MYTSNLLPGLFCNGGYCEKLKEFDGGSDLCTIFQEWGGLHVKSLLYP